MTQTRSVRRKRTSRRASKRKTSRRASKRKTSRRASKRRTSRRASKKKTSRKASKRRTSRKASKRRTSRKASKRRTSRRALSNNHPKWRVQCHDIQLPKIEKNLRKEFGKDNIRKTGSIAVKRSSTGWQIGNDVWVGISAGYIYISYKNGRASWILCNIEPSKRPKIKFSDETKTLWINNFGVRFQSQKEYEFSKVSLKPFTKSN